MAQEPQFNERLLAVQASLKAPKGQYNSFGKYKYRSCEDILEAVKPLLKEHGLTLTVTDEVVLIGNRYYVKATAEVTDGTKFRIVSAYAREPQDKKGMDDSQITGTASSYARKYALNGLFLIDDTKDADATNTHGADQPEEPSISREQWEQLCNAFNDCAAMVGANDAEGRNALWAEAQAAVGVGFVPSMGAKGWAAARAWFLNKTA